VKHLACALISKEDCSSLVADEDCKVKTVGKVVNSMLTLIHLGTRELKLRLGAEDRIILVARVCLDIDCQQNQASAHRHKNPPGK
jgi:hypothetical protein